MDLSVFKRIYEEEPNLLNLISYVNALFRNNKISMDFYKGFQYYSTLRPTKPILKALAYMKDDKGPNLYALAKYLNQKYVLPRIDLIDRRPKTTRDWMPWFYPACWTSETRLPGYHVPGHPSRGDIQYIVRGIRGGMPYWNFAEKKGGIRSLAKAACLFKYLHADPEFLIDTVLGNRSEFVIHSEIARFLDCTEQELFLEYLKHLGES